MAAPVAGISGAAPAWAQAPQARILPALSETLDYNGHWAIDYPAGWVLDLSGFVVIASTPSAVGTLMMNNPLPTGTLVMGIVPPETNGLLGIVPGMSLEDAARRVASIYAASDVSVVPFETVAGPAVTASFASVRMPGGSNLIVVDRDGTTFVVLVVVEDFAGATPLLQAMLATLR
ncbi:MAG: hypothetical protein KIT43_12425 [Bauldia sp.]|nr:hypothetical protein [Bauldia sp.]